MKLPTLKLPQLSVPGAKKPPAPAPGQDAVQKWLPVKDVSGGLIVRADGVLVAVIRIEPAPFSLLSDRERERRIAATFEAFQGLPGAAQVISLPRPLDLDAYISSLEGLLAEAEGARRAVLRGYLQYVRGLAAGGIAVERRFYILIPGEARKKGGREELLARAREFAAALARADLTAHLCDDREILDLLFVFFNPSQAAFERPAEPAAAPIYRTAKEVVEGGID
ncbi:MAG: hypothetical protein H5U01_08155 [Clostridia bacterium]|nr:hypothetical protein [Clostridia bacterium]